MRGSGLFITAFSSLPLVNGFYHVMPRLSCTGPLQFPPPPPPIQVGTGVGRLPDHRRMHTRGSKTLNR